MLMIEINYTKPEASSQFKKFMIQLNSFDLRIILLKTKILHGLKTKNKNPVGDAAPVIPAAKASLIITE